MKQPQIYNYLDYRVFLKDLFDFRKEKNSNFSYRYFSGKAGFSSPNFLKLVTEGQRNLSNEGIAKVAKGFSMKKQESEFFEYLVLMNQAATHEEKNHYYKKMTAIRGFASCQKLEKESYEYFSKWYYPVVREVAILGSCDFSPERIAKALKPQITSSQAKKALKLLVKLGLLKKDENGKWEQSSKIVGTAPEVNSLTIANFHREMIGLAAEAIEQYPSEKRDITALTLNVKEEMMPQIKQKIASFRKELLEMALRSGEGNQAIQVNFQAFPLSDPISKEDSND